MTIDLLFPTPVYRVTDTDDFIDREALLDCCLEVATRREVRQRAPNQFHRVTSSHLAADRLHTEPGFSDLTRHVEKHARKFARSLGYHYGTPRVMQMWVNSGKPGDFVYPHAHPGRHVFLAGVFYVRCDPLDGISILSQQSREEADVTNELNTTGHYYEGQEGRLLLFRPETLHSTFPQQGESRVIVSFNLKLVDGE
jgi:uncharacterized protein (TIGR02466 family)